MSLAKDFTNGIIRQNPTFVLMLGMCPVLAVTNNAINGFSMGAATLFVLACSNMVISLIRHLVPKTVRIPCYIIVIAAFVTVVDLLLAAYVPSVHKALGIFIPLIVMNCIVLGRAEAFACKNGVIASIADGAGMGLGFTMSLTAIGGLREFFTSGSLFSIKLIEGWTHSFMLMGQAPGAFILLGLLFGLINWKNQRKARKEGRPWSPPGLGCRQCNLCDLGKQ